MIIGINETKILIEKIEEIKKENQKLKDKIKDLTEEIEETKEEKQELKEEFDTMKEMMKNFINDLNQNDELIDIEYLKDFLESYDMLSNELKNGIDLFQKLAKVKQNIEEYANHLNFV